MTSEHDPVTQNLVEELERLVDSHGLTQVVVALSMVCDEKAGHLRANWQDPGSAAYWEHDAKVLEKAACKVER